MDVFVYWRQIDSLFARAIRQIEEEEERMSDPENPEFRNILSEWASVSRDGVRLLSLILSLPLGQGLYVAKKLREERLPVLSEMARHPLAEDGSRRIRQAIARRWLLRALDPERTRYFLEIAGERKGP